MPVELKVLIFSYLDYNDLSSLSTVSKSFRDIIINHFLLNKERFIRTFQKCTQNGCSTEDYFQMANDLGLLIKRSTFIYPIVNRIKLIINMFQIIDLKAKLNCVYETDKPSFKNFIKAIKSIFSRIIKGWRFKEVLKLIDEFELYFNHFKIIQFFLSNEFGVIKFNEQYLRFFYRKIIFESFDDNLSRGKWLNYFLNYHTNITSDAYQKITYQAKLILLLFSPVFQEEDSDENGVTFIDWYCFSNQIFINEGLDYLGFAFKLLQCLKLKSRPNITLIFKTVTNIAFYWLNENTATLLYYSGFNVAKQILDSLVKKEEYITILNYLVNLFIVESKLCLIGKIHRSDSIANLAFEHLECNLPAYVYENLIELVSFEFINIARSIETANEEREHLEIIEIVDAQRQFYEWRLKKKMLN